jgi:hypothetical protein
LDHRSFEILYQSQAVVLTPVIANETREGHKIFPRHTVIRHRHPHSSDLTSDNIFSFLVSRPRHSLKQIEEPTSPSIFFLYLNKLRTITR